MKKIVDDLTVLDCTFRDGGYYNAWDYDCDLVERYLSDVQKSGVDVIEIGFRYLPKDRFLGAFAYSTDNYLSTLNLPSNKKIGVMVDAKEIFSYDEGVNSAINKLFARCENSPVDLVRIAVHFNDLEYAQEIAVQLKALGYELGLNLMQAAGKSLAELADKTAVVASWGCIDVLYFADSLGNMSADEVVDFVGAIKSEWGGPIGIHTHDNKGQALENCIAAIEAGVSWVDGTVLGMGRGAGNVATETLLMDLSTRLGIDRAMASIFSLSLEVFQELKEQYGWGPSLLYRLSAAYGVHPTYVQNMVGDIRYGPNEVLQAIEFLRTLDASSFKDNILTQAFASNVSSQDGSWDGTGWCADKDVLILGAGPSVKRHADAINHYVESNNPSVLSLNINRYILPENITAYVACHENRILMDAPKYGELKKPIILPFTRMGESLAGYVGSEQVWDYGVQVEQGKLVADANHCTVCAPLAIAYALCVATVGKAKRILLAGFDGFSADDPRQHDLVNLFENFQQQSTIPLQAITSTTYPVPKGSVYALDIA